ncbi:protein of unknown function [Shewanella benthica]|uniref:Uncharacterized protein n=1 Tax=Shewanella benthica TaxID=43661 RepID=A0A330LZR2_9GAMM|nr:protein of unknown function [Shewanella benthica]
MVLLRDKAIEPGSQLQSDIRKVDESTRYYDKASGVYQRSGQLKRCSRQS